MLFKTDAEKAFGVETYLSPEMDNAIKLWEQLEGAHGLKPPWVKGKVETINFSNTIADELAKLITQNIDIKVEGLRSGMMPEQMQKVIDEYFLQNAPEIMNDVVKFGGVMAKWNGKGIEFLRPDRFLVTEYDSNGYIHGCIFFSHYQKEKKFYTRAEWHRFEDVVRRTDSEDGPAGPVRIYRVSNKAFVSDQQDQIGRETSLKNTKWADIEPEAQMENLKMPLFRYIKCPIPNIIDPDSPFGVPCFANCITELRLLDQAMSGLGVETKNSAPMMIVDQSVIMYANQNGIELPEWIANVGNLDTSNGTAGSPVELWQPQLQVTSRKEGINFYLSVIGFKAGFDPGYFVFDGQTIQATTATQVRVTQKRTADTVISYRDVLDRPIPNGDGRTGAIHDIAYIINAMLIAAGVDGVILPDSENENYKLFCSFSDLLANEEEDKAFDYQLAQNKYMAKWRFLVRRMGLTEEEAKAMVKEAADEEKELNPEADSLFGEG